MDRQRKYLSTPEPVSVGLSSRDALSFRQTFPVNYCSWLTIFQDLGLRCAGQNKNGFSITPSNDLTLGWQADTKQRTKSGLVPTRFPTGDKSFVGVSRIFCSLCRVTSPFAWCPGTRKAALFNMWTILPISPRQDKELEPECNQLQNGYFLHWESLAMEKNVSWTKQCV